MPMLPTLPRFRVFAVAAVLVICAAARSLAQSPSPTTPHVIELVADHDSRYRMDGKVNPELTFKAGEPVLLRITANRAKTWDRDGAIHGFALLHKDRSKVPGWNLRLKPGKQEFALTAPSEPGEYVVICTVICSDDHEGMTLKVKVLPATAEERQP